MSESNNKQTLLIAVIAVLIIALGGLGYYVYQLSEEKTEIMGELDDKEEELLLTYTKLDSVSIRLKETLAEKERMGEVDDSLRIVIQQLEEEKLALKDSKNLSVSRYNEIKNKIKGYENLLAEKDKEISRLSDANEQLEGEKRTLEGEKQQLNEQVSDLETTKEQIETRLEEASNLRAYSIAATAISKKGKERTGGEYRRKQVERLKVTFKIGENKAADAGNRKVFMRVLDASKKTLSGTNSGNFELNGSSRPYSATKEILFDKNEQAVTILFDNSQEYEKGTHLIELYTEGIKIGGGSFTIK